MLVFVTWAVWFTDKLTSPLLNAYLLVIITSALALGKVATLVEMLIIAACFWFLGTNSPLGAALTLGYVGRVAAQLAPMVLVAYVTTMFSADIRYGLNRAKLMSETDELTGVFNRRGFAIAADPLFAQAQRHNRAVSLLMVDVDNLKTINDQGGHTAGDEAIKVVAQCIVSELRLSDVVARHGGDEFVALLAETPAKEAMDVALRIKDALSLAAERSGNPLLTASIGIATCPEDGRNLDVLLGRADRAMYAAKQAGRNGVVKYSH
jgi:diguanylate cyclase (GGDEF)-like protein